MAATRVVAIAAGVVFAFTGVWGVAASVGTGSIVAPGAPLFGQLTTNLLLGIVHLVIATSLVIGFFRGERLARRIDVATGALLLVLGMVGIFIADTPANVLAAGGVGNALHFAASFALLVTGLGAPERSDDEPAVRQAPEAR